MIMLNYDYNDNDEIFIIGMDYWDPDNYEEFPTLSINFGANFNIGYLSTILSAIMDNPDYCDDEYDIQDLISDDDLTDLRVAFLNQNNLDNSYAECNESEFNDYLDSESKLNEWKVYSRITVDKH